MENPVISDTEPSSPPDPLSPPELKKALKAFKKRLKLTRMDDESSLGVGPMSSGRSSGIVAVAPPSQYAQAVWDELVRLGKLRYSGHGLYELIKL